MSSGYQCTCGAMPKGMRTADGRDRDHAAGEDAEQDGIEQVVDDGEPGAADAAQVPVEGQPCLHRDRRAQQRPGQHRQGVADGQAKEHVPDAGAPVDEHHADDELGGGHVLAGQRSREVAGPEQAVLGDRFAVELVERIEVLGGRRCGHGREYTRTAFGPGSGSAIGLGASDPVRLRDWARPRHPARSCSAVGVNRQACRRQA